MFWLLVGLSLVLGLAGGEVGLHLLRQKPESRDSDVEVRAKERGWAPAVAGREPAPDFQLLNQDGTPRRLSDYLGRGVLLAFYDGSERSRIFCREFQKIRKHVSPKFIREVVVTQMTAEEIRRFRAETGSVGDFLRDPDGAVHRKFQVGAMPCAWVIDRAGIVYHAMPPVDEDGVPEGHLSNIVRAFRTVSPPRPRPIPDPVSGADYLRLPEGQ